MASSSGPRHTLLLFCKFLSHRVRADHLDVLYRIVVEFLEESPCFTRVEEMLYRVYPMVAILPTELPDPSVRAKADRLLQRMREQECDGNDESDELQELHAALRGRIELANWDVLVQIYREFMVGRDRTLRAFVALQPEAIAILPVCPSTCPAPGNGHDITDADRLRNLAPQQTHRVKDEAEFEEETKSEEGPASWDVRSFRRFRKDSDPAVAELFRIVRAALDDIEATTPWTRVYDVSKITYPFDAKQHPVLAKRLAKFWKCHARAVWQRHFWYRFPGGSENDECKRLRYDDRAAGRYFEESVMLPTFNELGAEFFVDLDSQSKRHRWWWFREPLVDLVHMAGAEGTDYCIRYMQTQATTSPPTPHPQFHALATRHDMRSPSMWSTSRPVKHIHDAVVALRKKQNAAGAVSAQVGTPQKRARPS